MLFTLKISAQVAYDVAKPYVEKAAETAVPILEEAAKEGVRVATPLVNAAANSAASSLKQSGVDVASVSSQITSFSTKAIDTAAPVAKEALGVYSAAESLAVSDPGSFITATGAAAALVAISPVLLPLLVSSLRGYKGDLAPAKALDMLGAQDATLVDLRTPSQVTKPV